MLIALYKDRDDLPVNHRITTIPTQPEEVFDPRRHGRRKVLVDDEMILMRKSWAWPILMGLRAVNFRTMAHVSIFFRTNVRGKIWRWTLQHHLCVQITDIPAETDKRGIPITTGKIFLRHVYGGQIGSQFRPEKQGKAAKATSTLWTSIFESVLRDKKRLAFEDAKETRDKSLTAAKLSKFLSEVIPD